MAKCSRVAAAWHDLLRCWRPLNDLRGLVGLPPTNGRGTGLLPAVTKPASGAGGQSAQRIGLLSGVRALSLLWVLAFHVVFLGAASDLRLELSSKHMPSSGDDSVAPRWVASWAAQPLTNGDLGVDAFFTLSGVLIATLWLREVQKNAGRFGYVRFAARRWMRLAPMLVVGMLAKLLVGHLAGNLQHQLDACAHDWWRILLMVNNFTSTGACLGQAWSVAVEFQLYLFAPLLLWAVWDPTAFRPRPLWWLRMAAAWLMTPLLRVLLGYAQSPGAMNDMELYYLAFNRWGVSSMPLSYTASFTRAAPFLAGMAAALAVAVHKQHAAGVGGGSVAEVADGSQPQQQAGKGAAKDVEQQRVSAAPAAEACCSSGAGMLWRLLLLGAVDALALALLVAFAFLGGCQSRHTYELSTGLDLAITIFGRPLFGAALAWVLGAMLLGRLRALAAVLSLRLWLPAAGLSYGAYLLQDLPLLAVPSWTSVGVTTMFAAWAVVLFEFAYFSLACLLMALPFYATVEMPLQRVIKRGY